MASSSAGQGAPSGDAPADRPPTEELEPVAPTWTGRLVGGRFRIGPPLGQGGVAVVYRAEHEALDRPVAVKALHAYLEAHTEARGRFLQEAKALAALTHPHVVTLIDCGVEDQTPYIVMELLEGESLDRALEREGFFEVERAVSIARQMLRAIAFAHERGLLHRDIKPGNVFLTQLGDETHVKLLDFGLAKFLERESQTGRLLTRVGTVSGTPAYMAPEQAGAQEVGARADVYAVSVVLFEMLAGRRPIPGSGPGVMRAKLTTDPPLLSSVRGRGDVSAELDAVLRRGLARRPENRFESAAAMLAALDRAAAAPPPKPRRPPRRPGAWWPALLLLPLLPAVTCVVTAAVVIAVAGSGDDAGGSDEVAESGAFGSAPGSSLFGALSGGEAEPLEADDLPQPLAEVQALVEAGDDIPPALHTELVQYARDAPEDARAQLLLGHVYAARGWRSDALGRYETAVRMDAEMRRDPRMLDNLIEIAGHRGRLGTRAGDAVVRIWGAEATEAIDRRLDSPETRPAHAERLRELRRRVASTDDHIGTND